MLAQLLQFLFSGLTVGATYALAALGFTLIYNASHVINFAQGEFIMLGGMLAVMFVQLGLPLPLALLLAIVLPALVGILVEKLAIEPVKGAETVSLIIITIGASLVIRGLVQVWLGKGAHSLPAFSGDTPIVLLGATLMPQSLWVLISPMVVPVVIVGVGAYLFFAPLGLANSYLGLVLVHAALGVPFVVITVSATLRGFNPNLVRASASLGGNPVYTFFRITLPLIAPGVISGGLFAFAASFDEVVVTLFLAGPDQTTLPRQMFAGIKENISPTIAAAATVLILFSIVLLLTLEWLRGRSEKMRTAASAA